jgi:hypothetical protein
VNPIDLGRARLRGSITAAQTLVEDVKARVVIDSLEDSLPPFRDTIRESHWWQRVLRGVNDNYVNPMTEAERAQWGRCWRRSSRTRSPLKEFRVGCLSFPVNLN